MRLARLIIVLTGFCASDIEKVVTISRGRQDLTKVTQLDFCAVRSKSCNSKSNCPIGIKIDMYISHEVCKGRLKGIFFYSDGKGVF